MKVAVLGSTGHIGAEILKHLSSRGKYEVIAVARDGAKVPKLPHVTGVSGDISNVDGLAKAVNGADIVLSALSFNVPAQTIIDGAKKAGAKRVIAVGGTGSLRQYPNGPFIVENPDFNPRFKEVAMAGLNFYLDMRKNEDYDWTILTMASGFGDEPVLNRYQIGGDTMLTDSNGVSQISYADFALAMVDEIDNHRFPKDHVAVAH